MQVIDIHGVSVEDLLQRVESGTTLALERDGRIVAHLSPVGSREQKVEAARLRRAGFGFMRGQVLAPDDIKAAFVADIEEMYYGSASVEPSEEQASSDR